MKVFPLLIKELLDNQHSSQASEAAGAESLQETGRPSGQGEAVLAEIPDVTDPPALPSSEGGKWGWRRGGRLFGPSLSARILLGGGVVLFLIAALPVFFRSEPLPEQHNNSLSSENSPQSVRGDAKNLTKTDQSKPEGAITTSLGSSIPLGKPPHQQKTSQQAATQKALTTPSTTPRSGSVQPQSEGNSELTSPKSPSDKVQKTASQIAHSNTAPPSSGQQNPGTSPSSNSTASIPSGGAGRQATQPNPPETGPRPDQGGGLGQRNSDLTSQARSREGYFSQTRSPLDYYPTSANYPNFPNSQVVYYPSTDGRWYPVAFPPNRGADLGRSYAPTSFSFGREGTVPCGQGTFPSGGPNPSQASGSWNHYYEEEVSRRPVPEGAKPPSSYQNPSAFPPAPGRSASLRREAISPAEPGYQLGHSNPSYGPYSAQFNAPLPAKLSPSSGGPPNEFQSINSGISSTPFGVQEPGVARFNGTIEQPPIRSAYDGTGSSLY